LKTGQLIKKHGTPLTSAVAIGLPNPSVLHIDINILILVKKSLNDVSSLFTNEIFRSGKSLFTRLK
ncbi:hypothetical protein, partial [Escherichia coli]|uniref:hypothetical protein n=1 Tax=Escherichia coli TaxID=562 RepID=UPI001BDCB8F0